MTDRQTDRHTYSIDLFKFVFSFFIIGIHTPALFSEYSEAFGWFLQNVFFRIAVSFFFITSAYFFFRGLKFENGRIVKSKENFSRLKKYFLRLLLLYTIWSMVYLLWSIPSWIETGWFSFKAFVDFGIAAVFNSSYYHLWFLVRLLYVIPFMYFVLRHLQVKYFVIISLAIYVVGLFYGGSYSWVGFPFLENTISLPYLLSGFRTALFVVMPICSISLLVDRIPIQSKRIYLLSVVFLAAYFTESILLRIFLGNNDYIVFTALPMTLTLFMMVKSITIRIDCHYALRKLSTLIYVIHPLIIGILNLIIKRDSINSIVYYLLVAVSSCLVSFLLYAMSKRINILKYLM